MTYSQKLLFQIYKKFYDQRSVLQTAPSLTIDINQTNLDAFDFALADNEVAALISFLLGIKDLSQVSFDEALALIEKYYNSQPQWQNLLLNYFSYRMEKEKEEIINQQIALLDKLLENIGQQEDGQEY